MGDSDRRAPVRLSDSFRRRSQVTLQPYSKVPVYLCFDSQAGTYNTTNIYKNTLVMATTQANFRFPRLYHFPAFFTRQPTIATRDAQLRAWSDFILSYCRHHHLWRLSVVDAIDTPLFYNSKLKKRLSLADAREVLDWMTRKEGGERVAWVGKEGQKAVCWVYWRRPEEWAGILSDWVRYRFHHPCLTQND